VTFGELRPAITHKPAIEPPDVGITPKLALDASRLQFAAYERDATRRLTAV
jgi:hypothetical protein